MKTIYSHLLVRACSRLLAAAAVLFVFSFPVPAQFFDVFEVEGKTSSKINRKRGVEMLRSVKEIIQKFYYDKTFHGIDLDARFKAAEEKVNTLDTNSDIFRTIAALVLEFRDSHTRFVPPARVNRVEYGFTTQMIGNDCIVTDVKKGSDAERKGLRPGDVIASIGKYAVTRGNLWELNYNLYSLSPLAGIRIFVRNDDGATREIVIESSVKSREQREAEAKKRRKEKLENPYKCQIVSAETIACRLETFSVRKGFIDKMMSEASKYRKLILDLRGNGGGHVVIEEYLTGHFFDREIKIGTMISRKKKDERMANPQRKNAFSGELIVLVDSNSASAAEVFARIIQLEKRGKIVGDVTAGAVMTSYFISAAGEKGTSAHYFYGLNVTMGDLIMSDGNRLENVGVTPDHLIGPTNDAWLKKTDPVLAYAADLLGAKITPTEAGKFQFFKSRFEDDNDEEHDSAETPANN